MKSFGVFFIIDTVEDQTGQDLALVKGIFIEQMFVNSSGDVTEYTDGIKVIRMIE